MIMQVWCDLLLKNQRKDVAVWYYYTEKKTLTMRVKKKCLSVQYLFVKALQNGLSVALYDFRLHDGFFRELPLQQGG